MKLFTSQSSLFLFSIGFFQQVASSASHQSWPDSTSSRKYTLPSACVLECEFEQLTCIIPVSLGDARLIKSNWPCQNKQVLINI